MKIYVILLSEGDGYTYWCNNVFDSAWSDEGLALERLYELEQLNPNKNDPNFEITIKETTLDTKDPSLCLTF